jgi:hypothetical protein
LLVVNAGKHLFASVTSTGAIHDLPITGQQEGVVLVGIHWDKQFLLFPFVSWSVQWGSWVIQGTYKENVARLLGLMQGGGVASASVLPSARWNAGGCILKHTVVSLGLF